MANNHPLHLLNFWRTNAAMILLYLSLYFFRIKATESRGSHHHHNHQRRPLNAFRGGKLDGSPMYRDRHHHHHQRSMMPTRKGANKMNNNNHHYHLRYDDAARDTASSLDDKTTQHHQSTRRKYPNNEALFVAGSSLPQEDSHDDAASQSFPHEGTKDHTKTASRGQRSRRSLHPSRSQEFSRGLMHSVPKRNHNHQSQYRSNQTPESAPNIRPSSRSTKKTYQYEKLVVSSPRNLLIRKKRESLVSNRQMSMLMKATQMSGITFKKEYLEDNLLQSMPMSGITLKQEIVEDNLLQKGEEADGGNETFPMQDPSEVMLETMAQNEECENAVNVQVEELVSGIADEAGSALAMVPSCRDNALASGGGVWYRLDGANNQLQTMFSSNFSAVLTVYKGSDCENLECVGAVEGAPPNNDFGSLLWFAQEGVRYFISMSSMDSASSGGFELISLPILFPQNEFCSFAAELYEGDAVFGSTRAALGGVTFSLDNCGSATTKNDTAGGVYYKINGTGGALEASVKANFELQLSVYTGADCYSLSCVGGTQGIPPEANSAYLVWDSLPDEEYFIFVHGVSFDTGDFELKIGALPTSQRRLPQAASMQKVSQTTTYGAMDVPEANNISDLNEKELEITNDDCPGAIRLLMGLTIFGSTENATADQVSNCGNNLDNSSAGVWYRFRAQENSIAISLFSEFHLNMSIFLGSHCNNLLCVKDVESMHLAHVLDVEIGARYYVLVYGSSAARQGSFSLAVDNVMETIPHGSTSDASAEPLLEIQPDVGGILDQPYSSLFSPKKKVHNDKLVRLPVAPNFDYFGTVSFDSIAGQTYHIYIHGGASSDAVGEYELLVEDINSLSAPSVQAEAPLNDDCSAAIPLSPGETVQGLMQHATNDEVPACGLLSESALSRGLWYKLEGIDATFNATVVADFEVEIVLYGGFDCSDTVCVASSHPSLVWAAEEEVVYYLYLVTTFPSQDTNTFSITVQQLSYPWLRDLVELPPPSSFRVLNTNCRNAIRLELGKTLEGSTTNETNSGSPGPDCGGSLGNGVWYRFRARALPLEVKVVATFSVRLTIFVGSGCQKLVCIDQVIGSIPGPQLVSYDWDAQDGERHYLVIDGVDSQVGDFNVSVVESVLTTPSPVMDATNLPENDSCRNAIRLRFGHTLEGSTATATPADDIPSCRGSLGNGVWYRFRAMGAPLQVKVGANYAARLTVIVGSSCINLQCLDQVTGYLPEVQELTYTWHPMEGERHYIVISGLDSKVGDFNVSVMEIPLTESSASLPSVSPSILSTIATPEETDLVSIGQPVILPENDICRNAIRLKFGQIVEGSTEVATAINDTPNCGGSLGNGVWYRFRAMGLPLEVKVEASYLIRLTVFAGPHCNKLQCIEQIYGFLPGVQELTYDWDAEDGERHYIVIDGVNSDEVGEFNVSVVEKPLTAPPTPKPSQKPAIMEDSPGIAQTSEPYTLLPPNAECFDATRLAFGSRVSGSTIMSPHATGFPRCGENLENGVWYRFRAMGAPLLLYMQADFPARMTVFMGRNCYNLQCINQVDSTEFDISTFWYRWDAQEGERHYVFVDAVESQVGKFNITVFEMPTVPPVDSETSTPTADILAQLGGLEEDINLPSDSATSIPIVDSLEDDAPTVDTLDEVGGLSDINMGPPSDSDDLPAQSMPSSESTPVDLPTSIPSLTQTNSPTNAPTDPLDPPTSPPSLAKTNSPTNAPTVFIVDLPTSIDSLALTNSPANAPTGFPTNAPSAPVEQTSDPTSSPDEPVMTPSPSNARETVPEVVPEQTSSPTSSFKETLHPTILVSVQDQTTSPTGSKEMTSHPTLEVSTEASQEARPNDSCFTSTEIEIGDQVRGSVLLDRQSASGVCDLSGDTPTSDPFTEEASGAWHSLVGTGGTIMLTFSSSFDGNLDLFVGNSCNALTCVVETTQSEPTFVEIVDETIAPTEVETALDTPVGVAGESMNPSEAPTSFATAFYSDGNTETTDSLVTDNDDCSSAVTIEPGLDYFGSTREANLQDVQGCGSIVGGASAGRWYSIVGTGSGFKVEVNASYSIQLLLFEGNCDNLLCVDGTAGDGGELSSENIIWETQQDMVYYIYLSGREGKTVDFVLMVEELSGKETITVTPTGPITETSVPATAVPTASDSFEGSVVDEGFLDNESTTESPGTGSPGTEAPPTEPPATDEPVFLLDTDNDDCLSAVTIEPGLDYFGSTTEAKLQDVQGCGPIVGGVSAGRWYTIVGTGSGFKVEVTASYNMQLFLFEGYCDNLSCVDGTSGDGGVFPSGSISWESEQDIVYYIYVSGQEGETVDFALILVERDSLSDNQEIITIAPTDSIETSFETTAPTQVQSAVDTSIYSDNIEDEEPSQAPTSFGTAFYSNGDAATIMPSAQDSLISTSSETAFDTFDLPKRTVMPSASSTNSPSLFSTGADSEVLSGNGDAATIMPSTNDPSVIATTGPSEGDDAGTSFGSSFSQPLVGLTDDPSFLDTIGPTVVQTLPETSSTSGFTLDGSSEKEFPLISGCVEAFNASLSSGTFQEATDGFLDCITDYTHEDNLPALPEANLPGSFPPGGPLEATNPAVAACTARFATSYSSGTFQSATEEFLDCLAEVSSSLAFRPTQQPSIENSDQPRKLSEFDASKVEAGYYDVWDWDQLPPAIREAAVVLGYNETLWDNDGVAESDDYYWDELTLAQQEAAALLGYDQLSWDGDDEATSNPTLLLTPESQPLSNNNPPPCPTIVKQEGNVTFLFIFADRPPTELEEAQIASATFEFFEDTIKEAFPNVTYSFEVASTEFVPDPSTQYQVSFVGESLFYPCAPPLEEFQLVLDAADYESLLNDYVLPGTSEGDSLWIFIDDATYSGVINYPSLLPTSNPSQSFLENETLSPTSASAWLPSLEYTNNPTVLSTPLASPVPTNAVTAANKTNNPSTITITTLNPSAEVSTSEEISTPQPSSGSLNSPSLQPVPTDRPQMQVTNEPTAAPSQLPSEQPSIQVSVETYSPTMRLSDQGALTPLNDVCSRRVALQVSDVVIGSTVSASLDEVEPCGGNSKSAAGVWYSVNGTGNTLRASFAADYDAQLSVFEGLSCRSLFCVGGTEGFPIDFSLGQVIFDTLRGREYYIRVHGYDSQVGEFELTLDQVDRPANNVCSNATLLGIGDSIVSSTFFAGDDEVLSCGSTVEEGGPGIWYIIKGTGGRLNLTVEADFDAQVTVFFGENCDKLTCIDGASGDPPNFLSLLMEWNSEKEVTYFILLNGFFGQSGGFSMLVGGEIVDPYMEAAPSPFAEQSTSEPTSGTTAEPVPTGVMSTPGPTGPAPTVGPTSVSPNPGGIGTPRPAETNEAQVPAPGLGLVPTLASSTISPVATPGPGIFPVMPPTATEAQVTTPEPTGRTSTSGPTGTTSTLGPTGSVSTAGPTVGDFPPGGAGSTLSPSTTQSTQVPSTEPTLTVNPGGNASGTPIGTGVPEETNSTSTTRPVGGNTSGTQGPGLNGATPTGTGAPEEINSTSTASPTENPAAAPNGTTPAGTGVPIDTNSTGTTSPIGGIGAGLNGTSPLGIGVTLFPNSTGTNSPTGGMNIIPSPGIPGAGQIGTTIAGTGVPKETNSTGTTSPTVGILPLPGIPGAGPNAGAAFTGIGGTEEEREVESTCADAEEFIIGSTVVGTTSLVNNTADLCGSAQAQERSYGSWYSILGTGGLLTATLSIDSVVGQLSVFVGPCEQLSCLDGATNSTIDSINLIWVSDAVSTYYLLVQSGNSSSSEYELSITPVTVTSGSDSNASDSAVVRSVPIAKKNRLLQSDDPLEQLTCPTIIQQEGNLTFAFIFADRPPTAAEEQQLASAAFEFFENTIKEAFPDALVTYSGEVVSTDFMLNRPYKFILEFTGQSLFSPCAPTLEDYQGLLDSVEYNDLWLQYVRPVASQGPNNLLVFIESASYSGSIDYPSLPGSDITSTPSLLSTVEPSAASTSDGTFFDTLFLRTDDPSEIETVVPSSLDLLPGSPSTEDPLLSITHDPSLLSTLRPSQASTSSDSMFDTLSMSTNDLSMVDTINPSLFDASDPSKDSLNDETVQPSSLLTGETASEEEKQWTSVPTVEPSLMAVHVQTLAATIEAPTAAPSNIALSDSATSEFPPTGSGTTITIIAKSATSNVPQTGPGDPSSAGTEESGSSHSDSQAWGRRPISENYFGRRDVLQLEQSSPQILSSNPEREGTTLPEEGSWRNDLQWKCPNATKLEMDTKITGSLHEAQTYTNSLHWQHFNCGSTRSSGTLGLWYSIQGSGQVFKLRLETNFQAHVSIFSTAALVENGSPLCRDMVCINKSLTSRVGHTASIVAWNTIPQQLYYLFVHAPKKGADFPLPSSDDSLSTANLRFSLTIESTRAPINDNCLGATLLQLNRPVNGWTYFATKEQVDDCSNPGSIAASVQGIWYRFEGTGQTHVISLSALYQGRISVYLGGSECDSLMMCVIEGGTQAFSLHPLATSYPIPITERSFSWTTIKGISYYILVHGETASDEGEFYLTLNKV